MASVASKRESGPMNARIHRAEQERQIMRKDTNEASLQAVVHREVAVIHQPAFGLHSHGVRAVFDSREYSRCFTIGRQAGGRRKQRRLRYAFAVHAADSAMNALDNRAATKRD